MAAQPSAGGIEASLVRLLYSSRCALSGSDRERTDTVRAIAANASLRNREAGITGSLLFVQDSFVQVLEGPGVAVEQLFETICCDFRHEDVKLIDLVPVADRLFPEWGMAFLSESADTSVALRNDLEDIRFLAGVNAREAMHQMRNLLDSVPA